MHDISCQRKAQSVDLGRELRLVLRRVGKCSVSFLEDLSHSHVVLKADRGGDMRQGASEGIGHSVSTSREAKEVIDELRIMQFADAIPHKFDEVQFDLQHGRSAMQITNGSAEHVDRRMSVDTAGYRIKLTAPPPRLILDHVDSKTTRRTSDA